jgi:hypothetical protein
MKDKAIENLIRLETKRQKETLDLIASENMASKEVLGRLYPINIQRDTLAGVITRGMFTTTKLSASRRREH